jgi:predicted PurR-regulated permease PerM
MQDEERPSTAAEAASDWGSVSHVHTLVLMGVTAAGLYLCYRLASPFLPALAWALALTVLATPFQGWLESRLRRPNVAAMLCVLAIGLAVVGVASFAGQRLVQEAVSGAELVKAKVESAEWRRSLEAHPRLLPLVAWMDRQNLPATVGKVATWMTTTGAAFVRGSLVELVGLGLTFYLLFFLLRDRRQALDLLRWLSPLPGGDMDRLYRRISDTIYATVYGTLAVSVAQGVLGGLMFWWLGLPAPLLWGGMMALLAVVPVLGAFVVWVPVALYLALEGSWGKALILTLWGGGVVGTIDNLLRPVLVGRRLKLHTLLAFMSVVGGVILFGPAGIILGPVVLTITIELLTLWHDRTDVRITPGKPGPALARWEGEGGRISVRSGGAAAARPGSRATTPQDHRDGGSPRSTTNPFPCPETPNP